MTERDRWVRTMNFQSVDHVPDEEFGYWTETLAIWHEQNFPEHIVNDPQADRFFGFNRREHVPINLGLIPNFEHQVIDDTDEHQIIIDNAGVTCIIKKDGTSTIPKYLNFPIETRYDWEKFKERLNPNDPRRYPENWAELKQQWAVRDYPLGISVGSLFGWLRNWMSFEHVTITCIDDPMWIHDMMEHVTEFILTIIDRAVREVDLDFADFWEDMCFNMGPMISPAMFKEFMVPRYKRITDFLKQHGVDVVYVDCDGDINELVPLWLEGGVNCMFPLEIQSGSDPYPIREKYGEQVLLLGGVDKMQLIAGKVAIRKEIDRITPLVETGGYIPHVDHRCPPDVTYENYLYYLKTKREAFGIPEPVYAEA